MGVEIERKFLLKNEDWRGLGTGTFYRQGYLPTQGATTVRVRIAGETAFLTIKGATQGISRLEFEYPIPLKEAEQMLDRLCRRPLIEKTRYVIPYAGMIWEVDEFCGENAGLIVAEVELEQAEQTIDFPAWIGEEVTEDPRYRNSALSEVPFQQWGQS